MSREWSIIGLLGVDIRSRFLVSTIANNDIYVHAGLIPKYIFPPFILRYHTFRQIDDFRCRGPLVTGPEGPVWTRAISSSVLQATACNMLYESLRLANATRMIVGHTPMESGQIEVRCDGRLILIDTGISRYILNRPTILEIDNHRVYWEISVDPKSRKAQRRRLLSPLADDYDDESGSSSSSLDDKEVMILPPPENVKLPPSNATCTASSTHAPPPLSTILSQDEL